MNSATGTPSQGGVQWAIALPSGSGFPTCPTVGSERLHLGGRLLLRCLAIEVRLDMTRRITPAGFALGPSYSGLWGTSGG